MPLALLIIGALLVMAGITGNFAALGTRFDDDVLGGDGSKSFLQFAVGIAGIAIFFRLLGIPNAGRFFIVLVILVYLMQNSNVLNSLSNIGAAPGNA